MQTSGTAPSFSDGVRKSISTKPPRFAAAPKAPAVKPKTMPKAMPKAAGKRGR